MTIHVKATIEEGGRLTVDHLPLPPGQQVQLTITAVANGSSAENRYPLRGTPYRFQDPTEPAVDPSEWEINR